MVYTSLSDATKYNNQHTLYTFEGKEPTKINQIITPQFIQTLQTSQITPYSAKELLTALNYFSKKPENHFTAREELNDIISILRIAKSTSCIQYSKSPKALYAEQVTLLKYTTFANQDFIITQSKPDCLCPELPLTINVNGGGSVPAATATYTGSGTCLWEGSLTICGYTYRLAVGVSVGSPVNINVAYTNLTFPSVAAWNSIYNRNSTDCTLGDCSLFMPQGSDYTAGLPCSPFGTQFWPNTITIS
jgi:hypothetical protein